MINSSENIDYAMLEILQVEIENNCKTLEDGLVDLDDGFDPELIPPIMRSAHSMKGACRLVGLDGAVELAHAMEDYLTGLQKNPETYDSDKIDSLFGGLDVFKSLIDISVKDIPPTLESKRDEMIEIAARLRGKSRHDSQNAEKAAEVENKPKSEKKKTSANIGVVKLLKDEISRNSEALESAVSEGAFLLEKCDSAAKAAEAIETVAKISGYPAAEALATALKNLYKKIKVERIEPDKSSVEKIAQSAAMFASLAERDAEEAARILSEEAALFEGAAEELSALFEADETEEEKPQEVSVPEETDEPDPMLGLFAQELDAASKTLENGLLELTPEAPNSLLTDLRRAAHSIKGAARIVGVEEIGESAELIETIFDKALNNEIILGDASTDLLLRCVDIFINISLAKPKKILRTIEDESENIAEDIEDLKDLLEGKFEVPDEEESLGMFQNELKRRSRLLTSGIRRAETAGLLPERIESVAGAARSIKQAARAAGIDSAASLADLTEKALRNVTAEGNVTDSKLFRALLKAGEFFVRAARRKRIDLIDWIKEQNSEMRNICDSLAGFLSDDDGREVAPTVESTELDVIIPQEEVEEVDSEEKIETESVDKIESIVDKQESFAKEKEEESLAKEEKEVVPSAETREKTEELTNTDESVPDKSKKESTVESEPQEKTASLEKPEKKEPKSREKSERRDTYIRVRAANFDKLMNAAGEQVAHARTLDEFNETLFKIKYLLRDVNAVKEKVFLSLSSTYMPPEIAELFEKSGVDLNSSIDTLDDHISKFEKFSRTHERLTEKLYSESIAARMKPFSEGLFSEGTSFKKIIRDIAKKLGKKVSFEILGEETEVDRDILDRLKAPLDHLIRNALDHGIETPELRKAAGKPEKGKVVLEARHAAGSLMLTLSDDGKGIDVRSVKRKIIENNLQTRELIEEMTESEIFDFMFLPGFSTAEKVTEISGRGVGLDVVHREIYSLGGSIRIESKPGVGTKFVIRLPLTLSVQRNLIAELAGELYALPLSKPDTIEIVRKDEIVTLEDKQYCVYNGENLGIIDARQLFGMPDREDSPDKYRMAIISDADNRYGLVFDSFLGERDLFVKPLNPKLGKIANVGAGAIYEDGSPILILDAEDLVRSIHRVIAGEKIRKAVSDSSNGRPPKRILAVDDSLTVREVERKILEAKGYDVTTANNGVEGLNSAMSESFDLIVTDVDMPRMNGIELVRKLKSDPKLAEIPVMIVSYKDSEEDKLAGLDAGADYYLTKSSFHDDTMIDAVVALIGEPR